METILRDNLNFLQPKRSVPQDYNTYWVGITSAPVLVKRRQPVASQDLVEYEPELEEEEEDKEEYRPVIDFLEQEYLEDMHGSAPHEYEELLPGGEEDYGDEEDIFGGFGNGEFLRFP